MIKLAQSKQSTLAELAVLSKETALFLKNQFEFRPIAILWSKTRNVISLHPRITDRKKEETQIRVHSSHHFNLHNNRLE